MINKIVFTLFIISMASATKENTPAPIYTFFDEQPQEELNKAGKDGKIYTYCSFSFEHNNVPGLTPQARSEEHPHKLRLLTSLTDNQTKNQPIVTGVEGTHSFQEKLHKKIIPTVQNIQPVQNYITMQKSLNEQMDSVYESALNNPLQVETKRDSKIVIDTPVASNQTSDLLAKKRNSVALGNNLSEQSVEESVHNSLVENKKVHVGTVTQSGHTYYTANSQEPQNKGLKKDNLVNVSEADEERLAHENSRANSRKTSKRSSMFEGQEDDELIAFLQDQINSDEDEHLSLKSEIVHDHNELNIAKRKVQYSCQTNNGRSSSGGLICRNGGQVTLLYKKEGSPDQTRQINIDQAAEQDLKKFLIADLTNYTTNWDGNTCIFTISQYSSSTRIISVMIISVMALFAL